MDKKEWIEVKDLNVGDKVLLSSGKEVAISGIKSYNVEATKVYNFEVADNHTYFVGEDGVLVHNYQFSFGFDIFGDSVHNDITKASIAAYNQGAETGKEITKDEAKEILEGNISNDAPEGLLKLLGVMIGHSMEKIPFIGGLFASDRNSLTYKTHFGENQIDHGMARKPGESFDDTHKAIIDRAIEWYSQAIDPTNGVKTSAFYMGKISHLIQDAHSSSHILRNADWEVVQFQEYSSQDNHGPGDKFKSEPSRNMRDENGRIRAAELNIEALNLWKNNKSVEDFRKLMEQNVLQRAEETFPGGASCWNLSSCEKKRKDFPVKRE